MEVPMGKLKEPCAIQTEDEAKKELKKWKKTGYPKKIRVRGQRLAMNVQSLLEENGVESKCTRTGQTWIITPC